MKTILLPVDGSDHAAKAAEVGGDLASKHGASVVVLYVHTHDTLSPEQRHMAEVEHIVPSGTRALPWVTNMPAELSAVLHNAQAVDRSQEVLEFLASKVVGRARDILSEHGVPAEHIRFLVKNGDPAERIVETIAEIDADAIVMGSRGMSGVAGMLFGSVSRKVAHAASCTVVAVK